MDREQAKIKGIIVPGESLNLEQSKKEIMKEHETPDQYGKTKTVEFEDVIEEDGSRYTNYWAF